MTFTDRSQIVRKHGRESTDRSKELFGGILLAALVATPNAEPVPADALRRDRDPAVCSWRGDSRIRAFAGVIGPRTGFDIAGALTFVGVAVPF